MKCVQAGHGTEAGVVIMYKTTQKYLDCLVDYSRDALSLQSLFL